ncbi:MAG: sugar ABC transporter substrate-binding protein [Anaerolineae bacterium]
MKQSRLFLVTIVGLLLLALVFPAAAQGPVTITLSTWAGVDESAELQVIIDAINASQSDYQIVHQPIPSDYYTQVQTQIAGGSGADMYWIDQDHSALASEGVFMPLDECLANAAAGSAGDLSDYYPDVLQTVQFDGSTYGLPWIAQPVVTYFNRAMFDAAGLDYPTSDWTWDDFLEWGRALTQDTDGDGTTDQWGFIANGWPPPAMFVWQAGGDVIAEDLATSPLDSPEAVAGIEFYLQLAYNPELSPSADVISEQGFGELFKAGHVAMFMGGAADDLDRVEGLDVGVVSVPRNPDTGSNTTFAWTASTMISATTANPDLACAALQALTDGIQNWKIVSPRISQATVEHLISSEPRKEANAEAIMEAVPTMRGFRVIPRFLEWSDVFWSQFMNPLLNDETDLSVAELAAEVRPELEALLPGAE